MKNKAKRAQVTVIMGILLTILVIGIISYTAMRIWGWTDDRRVTQTFGEFIQKLNTVAQAPDGSSESVVLYLKDEYGIVGFSGAEDFEDYRTTEEDGRKTGKPQNQFLYIQRSEQCERKQTTAEGIEIPEQACICLYDFKEQVGPQSLNSRALAITEENKRVTMVDRLALGDEIKVVLHQCHNLPVALDKLVMNKKVTRTIIDPPVAYHFWKNGFLLYSAKEVPGSLLALSTRITPVYIIKEKGNVKICLDPACNPKEIELS